MGHSNHLLRGGDLAGRTVPDRACGCREQMNHACSGTSSCAPAVIRMAEAYHELDSAEPEDRLIELCRLILQFPRLYESLDSLRLGRIARRLNHLSRQGRCVMICSVPGGGPAGLEILKGSFSRVCEGKCVPTVGTSCRHGESDGMYWWRDRATR